MIVFLLLNSCIEDNILPPLTGELNPTAEMLVYFESLGDFPNSDLAPALASVEEVYTNLLSYLVIDVRDHDEYLSGHIQGAVNIQNDSLFSYVKNVDQTKYDKIILVSANGFSSVYYVCLLRLAGFDRVFSMEFGMAMWNIEFAGEWLDALIDLNTRMNYTNNPFPKGSLTSLPEINFQNKEAPIQERVENRIQDFISAGFIRNIQYRFRFVPRDDELTICYGKSRLYNAPLYGVDGTLGHANGVVNYADIPFFEFRAVQYLQTLPNDKTILIYDYNGQLSACMVAYLRVLGYDAASLNFGANQIFYSRMLGDVELNEYAFKPSLIKNLPYVIGE